MWSRFTSTLLIAAAAAYLVASAALAVAISATNRERIYDIREFNPEGFNPPLLAGAYLSRMVTPESVVFVGSSFTFGYPFAAAASMPSAFAARTGLPTVNASVIGASIEGIERYFLCEMQRRNLRARAIVVEIPLINEAHFMKSVLPQNLTRRGECMEGWTPSLITMIATHPSLVWLRRAGDDYSLNGDETHPITPIPDDYLSTPDHFNRIKQSLSIRIGDVLAEAGNHADAVYAFTTPASLDRVEKGGHLAIELRRQLAFGEAECVARLGPRCVRTADLSDRPELFYNVAHMNRAGNTALADRIAASMEGAKP
jgi:hypothetical protein